jgi:hypothetical protein
MTGAGWIAVAGVNVPWVLLIGIRAVRAFRDPDRWDGGGPGGVFSRRYVERQFERPRDESRLL